MHSENKNVSNFSELKQTEILNIILFYQKEIRFDLYDDNFPAIRQTVSQSPMQSCRSLQGSLFHSIVTIRPFSLPLQDSENGRVVTIAVSLRVIFRFIDKSRDASNGRIIWFPAIFSGLLFTLLNDEVDKNKKWHLKNLFRITYTWVKGLILRYTWLKY
jgi:hypothetical protein